MKSNMQLLTDSPAPEVRGALRELTAMLTARHVFAIHAALDAMTKHEEIIPGSADAYNLVAQLEQVLLGAGYSMDFDNTEWPDSMQHEAEEEGWAIFNYPEKPDIERDDDSDRFGGDPDAYAHIVARANEGSAMHLQALRVVNALNPEHLAEIRALVNSEIRPDLS